MGDEEDAALVDLDGRGHGAERLAVEVVGRLVEDEEVRAVPHGGAHDDLDLLAARERAHAVVGAELAAEADVLEVLLDVGGGERANVHAGHHGDLLVTGPDVLFPAGLDQLGGGEEGGARHLDALPLGLVLVLLAAALGLAADAGELLDEALGGLDLVVVVLPLEDVRRVHGGLLLVGHGHGDLVHGLLVVARRVTPADVLVRGLVEVRLNVVERVLGHVGHAKVRVRPAGTGGRLDLAGEALDHGRLASAVRADAADARRERDLHGAADDSEVVVDRVAVVDALHLHEGLALRLDALERSRLREGELELGLAELEVRARLRHLLDELGEVALVGVELEVGDLEDVGAAVVEEARVVRDHDRGHILLRDDPVLDPLDVHHVHVVGRLVEEEDVGVEEHGAGKRELHAPAAREGVDAVVLLGALRGRPADRAELGRDLLAGNVVGLDARVSEHVVDAREVRELAEDVGLDEDSADLSGGREAFDLLLRDRAHEGGLARVVAAEETVAGAALDLELGVVEKDLGTVRECELAVGENLLAIVLLLLFDDLLDLLDALGGDLSDTGGHGGRVEEAGEVRRRGGGPPLRLLHAAVDEGAADRGEVLLRDREDGVALADGGLDDAEDLALVGRDGLDLAVLAAKHVLAGLVEALQLLEAALADRARLRVRDGLGGLLKGREEERKERGRVERVLDELGHVVNDHRSLAAGGRRLLAEAADEERHEHGHGGRLHGLHEHDASELVHELRYLLGLENAGDEVLEDAGDVRVASNAERLLHGVLRGRLDLLLGVGHARGEARDDVREAGGGLGRGLLHGDGDEVEGVDAALPVDGVVEHAEDHRHDERDSRAGGGHEGAAGVGGLVADALVAVGAEEDDGLKSLEQVRLSRGAHRGGKRGDGLERASLRVRVAVLGDRDDVGHHRVEGRDALAGDEISEGGASRRGGTGITSAIDGGDGGGDTGVELREIGGKSGHCD
mmetsp:Transcript_34513/g.91640  ORF Transcript_34513/g.91640 Transcript_34513/m.91640 type:complete len:969 (+) Transcript_34513:1449-4355(+)